MFVWPVFDCLLALVSVCVFLDWSRRVFCFVVGFALGAVVIVRCDCIYEVLCLLRGRVGVIGLLISYCSIFDSSLLDIVVLCVLF